jgi:hypothetical protein
MSTFFNRTFDLNTEGAGGSAATPPPGGSAASPPPADAAPAGAGNGLLKHVDASIGEPGKEPDKAPDPAAPYVPEGLAETLRGKTDRETIDKLAAEIGKRGAPPAKPEEYQLELSPEMAKIYGDMKDDPVLPLFRQVAHKHGLDNKTFNGLFSDLHQEMAKAGLIEDIDDDAELAKLEPKSGDPAARRAEASKRLNATYGQLKGFVTRGVLSAAEFKALSASLVVGEGVLGLEKILKLLPAEHGLQPGGAPAADGMTEHERALRTMYPTMFKN